MLNKKYILTYNPLYLELLNMKKVDGFKNKNESRPRKRGARKKQRLNAHKRRLIGLGVPEDCVLRLNSRQMLDLLKNPNKTTKLYVSK